MIVYYYYKDNGLATIKESNNKTIVNLVQFYNLGVICSTVLTEATKIKNSLNCSVENVLRLVGWEGFAVPTRRQKKSKIFARFTAKSSRWFAQWQTWSNPEFARTHCGRTFTVSAIQTMACNLLSPQAIKCIYSERFLLVSSRWKSFFKNGTLRQNCNRICAALWGRNAFVAKTWQEL